MGALLIQVYEDLVPLLSFFAKDVFIDYYDNLIGNQQATYMADMFLSEEAISQEISEDTVFKLMLLDNMPIGFTEYKLDGDRVFISKLYMHKDYRKKGYGEMMLKDAIAYAKDNKKNKIYLTVNKHNPSYKIYLKWNFKNIESVVNDIGNGYVMDDYIMELDIEE